MRTVRCSIQLPAHALDMQRLDQFSQMLAKHPGACEVRLAIVDDNGGVTLRTLGDRFRVRRETGLFADDQGSFWRQGTAVSV